MRPFALTLLLAVTFTAGCLDNDDDTNDDAPVAPNVPVVGPRVPAVVTSVMTFTESVVASAVDYTGDLYEPTMEVSDTGVIYITGHTILVDTTGAPVFGSRDEGATWFQLPFAASASLPPPLQGATPPPSDEIFLAAGDDGWLYGVDITLATYPVNAWRNDGAEFAYHNPNAYDEAEVARSSEQCTPVPAKDRPWGAYSNGTLLMVSNPAGGPAQVGVMQVPPMLPAEAGGQVSTQWNLCAGPGGSIPGIPDIRADGLFAVPQRSQGKLFLVLGNKADVGNTIMMEVFPHTSGGEITSVYGIASFDRNGTLFVGISNNTEENSAGVRTGQLHFASSVDGGVTFAERTFVTGEGPVRHFYMDPNDFGAGALVVWAVDGETGYDWYTGHVFVDPSGAPVLENIALAINEGPQPSAHVTGAAVGPDGRAYLAMYRGEAPGSGGTPLSVFIQQDGPTLPVTP